jgi:hypothetical protein
MHIRKYLISATRATCLAHLILLNFIMLLIFCSSNTYIHREFHVPIKVNLRETGWECVDWINLNLDRDQCRAVVNTVMNLWVP